MGSPFSAYNAQCIQFQIEILAWRYHCGSPGKSVKPVCGNDEELVLAQHAATAFHYVFVHFPPIKKEIKRQLNLPYVVVRVNEIPISLSKSSV